MPKKWKMALEQDVEKAKTQQEKEKVLKDAAADLKTVAEANNVSVETLRASWG